MKRLLLSLFIAASPLLAQTVATPVISAPSGSAPQYASISDSTGGSTIFYTTDGSTPTSSSAVYHVPIWAVSTQTIKAFATHAGMTDSAVSSPVTYTIAQQNTRWSLMRGASTLAVVPFPPDDRMQPSTGVRVKDIWPNCDSTFHWTVFDAWVASAAAHSSNVVFTIQARPNCMTGLGSTTDGPPSDLATSAFCPATGTTTTDCSTKTFTIALMKHISGLSSQPSSPVACTVDQLEGGNEVATYSGSSALVGWSGTPGSFVQQSNDIAAEKAKWCSNTKMLLGSFSAVVGSNLTNPHYDVFAATALADVTAAYANYYQGVSMHNYPGRDNVTPAPPPTSNVSYSAAACTFANTPNNSCYVDQAHNVSRLQSVALNQSGTVSWSGHLAIYLTEGGFSKKVNLNGDNDFGIAYVAELVAVTDPQGPVTASLYLAYDGSADPWGDYWQTSPGVNSPWYQAFVQATAWEAAATSRSACVTSSITGGQMWRCPITTASATGEIDFCAVQFPASCSTTTAFTTQQDLTGVTSSTGGSLTLTAKPIWVYTPGAGTVATPTASPSPGIYSSTQTVTLSDATSGAAIHYTLDGSTPTIASALYSSALTITTTTTVKAIGTKTGMTSSAVMNSGGTPYTIVPPPPTATRSLILATSGVN